MITGDGTLTFQVRPNADRLFANRMRHVVNPVTGVTCGLVAGAALFLIAVQLLFAVTPSIMALVILLVAVVVYLLAVVRARTVSRGCGAYEIVIDQGGITQTDGGLSPARTSWTRLTRWLENDGEFVVASGGWRDRVVITVPKPGIAEEEQELIRAVLHAQIDPDDESIEDAFVEMDWDSQPSRRTDRRID